MHEILYYLLAALGLLGFFLAILPLTAYIVVKMATLGYLKGKKRFQELQQRKRSDRNGLH